MAESSLTFSSILSKYAPVQSPPVQEPIPRRESPPFTTKKQLQSRINDLGRSQLSASTSTINNRSSSILMAPTPLHISGNSPPTASGAAIKKRNLDSPPDYSPKAETDKERELRRKLLLEKMKIKKEAAIYESVTRISPAPSTMIQRIRGSGVLRASPPGSDAVSVAVASDPKKMSYKEKLAMAAKLQDEKRNLGVITHKARAPVMEKKEWQKKLGARKRTENAATSVAMYNKGKYPVILSGCERSGTATAQTLPRREMDNGILVRKPSQSRRFGNSKGKSIHKARPAEVPIKRKRSPSPISWRGRNSAASILKKTNRSHPSRSRYDDADDEDDDWIVDDDEDDDGLRGRAYSKQYRYAESDYESDSDMEAAGLDILDEEEKSHRKAIREDLEQEKLEKQLAAKKAAMRKKIVTK